MPVPGQDMQGAPLGVHLSDLSYLADIARDNHHSPAMAEAVLKRRMRLLLLAFDAVYIQTSQLIFQTDFQTEVVERLVADDEFQCMLRSGLVRILHSRTDPQDSVGAQMDRWNTVRWPFADSVAKGSAALILSAPVHSDLNSVLQSRSALAYLAERVRWRRREIDPDRTLAYGLRCHADEHGGRLMSEHLLSKLVYDGVGRPAIQAVSAIINEAYFQDTTVGGTKVVRYLPDIRPEDETGVADRIIPYLYSPGFLQLYASAWLTPAQVAALSLAGPAFFIRLRREGSWASFQGFFHGVLVQHLSKAVRTRFDATGVHSETLAGTPLGLSSFMSDEMIAALPLLDTVPVVKSAKSFLERLFRTKKVARYVANLGNPEVARFFDDVARTLVAPAPHGSPGAWATYLPK